MASIKLKFKASVMQNKEGTLYFQVIHKRVVRQISTGYKLFPFEWDADSLEIVQLPNLSDKRREYLLLVKDRLSESLARFKDIITRLERLDQAYTADDVVGYYHGRTDENGLMGFGRNLIIQLKQVGKKSTAETYACTLNSFARFRQERDVLLEEVESGLMIEYEIYLKSVGVCPNTSSFYMRNLRAIYNRAVEKELTLQRNPFKYVYTGIEKTVKRAIPLKDIRQIRDLDLTLHPQLDYARDIFMFSFYTRGMSFVDMAYLRKKDLQSGILSYRRRKTNQQLFIKWEKPMQDIIDKYDTSGSPYLLPIIKNTKADEQKQYKNASHLVNAKLKKIGRQIGLPILLTSYVARHAWASIAKSKNIPISTISEAMGHDSETTTRIYLASLDTSVVDKANSIILKSL